MPKSSPALDPLLQALGDPTRRHLVERLIAGPTSVSVLARPLAMSLPAVMQHLQVLEDCGLVRSTKAGRVRTCHVVPEGLRVVEAWVVSQRTTWEERLDRLEDLLTDDAGPVAGSATAASTTVRSSRSNRHTTTSW